VFEPLKLFAFEKTALVVIEGLYLISAIFYSPPAMKTKKLLKAIGFAFHILAVLLTAGFLLMRFFVTGHAPFVVFYEALVFLAFSISFAFLIFSWRKGVFGFGRGASGLSWLLTVVALIQRLVDQSGTYPRYLVPQLSNSLFEPHAATAFLAYGFFTLAFFTALTSLTTSRKEVKAERRSAAEFFLWPGVIIFTASLILASSASESAWGTWWMWEPKWIGSLAVWLLFVAALALRRSKERETASGRIAVTPPRGKEGEVQEGLEAGRQKGGGGLFSLLVIAGFLAVLLTFLFANSRNHKFL
jgi:ABC-type transport system involved in cytochrome c biogenesis permease subunit